MPNLSSANRQLHLSDNVIRELQELLENFEDQSHSPNSKADTKPTAHPKVNNSKESIPVTDEADDAMNPILNFRSSHLMSRVPARIVWQYLRFNQDYQKQVDDLVQTSTGYDECDTELLYEFAKKEYCMNMFLHYETEDAPDGLNFTTMHILPARKEYLQPGHGPGS